MSWLRRDTPPTILYADGSCLSPKKGKCGGWAAIIMGPGEKVLLSGAENNTTNNRMELTAVIEGLKAIPEGSNVYVYTDSKYVQHGMLKWMYRWKLYQWKTITGADVANADLWKTLDMEASRHLVSWHWVRGHDGNEHNEHADKLATKAARERWAVSGQHDYIGEPK